MTAIVLHTDTYTLPSVEVLRHTSRVRVAILNDDGLPRTLAVTLFPQWRDPALREVNLAVKSNGLMGKTFREFGFQVAQNRLSLMKLWMPSGVTRFLGMAGPAKLKVEVYGFYGSDHFYGIVIEFAKDTVHLPERPRHGAMSIWQLFGRIDEFYAQLHNRTATLHGRRTKCLAKLAAPAAAATAIIRSVRQLCRL